MTSRTRRTRKTKRRAHQSSQEDSAQSSSDSSESSAYSVHDQSGDGNPVAEIDELANDDDDMWEDVQDGQAAVPEHAGVTDGANAQDNLPGDDDGGVSQPDDEYPIHEFPLTQRRKERERSVISISSAPVTPVSRPR